MLEPALPNLTVDDGNNGDLAEAQISIACDYPSAYVYTHIHILEYVCKITQSSVLRQVEN